MISRRLPTTSILSQNTATRVIYPNILKRIRSSQKKKLSSSSYKFSMALRHSISIKSCTGILNQPTFSCMMEKSKLLILDSLSSYPKKSLQRLCQGRHLIWLLKYWVELNTISKPIFGPLELFSMRCFLVGNNVLIQSTLQSSKHGIASQ